uniref:GTP-binding protein Rhes-like n=1 Tax=Pundamilia nyererei TaxID=303518 RepID=A0A3B4FB69_9CICH
DSLEVFRLRIVVLGAPRVGKTSILRRYMIDGFVEEYKPTSEDFLRKLFRIRGETYQIDILDASRERDFPAKRRLSILTGDIFLLVFSLDDRSSFEEVCALRKEILAVPLVVCANKVDLQESEREITKAEVLQALGDDCAYFETSAKESTNLEQVFETLAKRGGLPTETGPSLMPIRKQPCKDLSLGALCVHSEKAFHFSCRKYVFPWALLLNLLSCN